MIRKMALLALFLVALSPSVGRAGVVPTPLLKPGQFVYSVPPGYAPPGLSARQQLFLNGVLTTLHLPFYVVIIEKMPRLNVKQSTYARQNRIGTGRDRDTRLIEVATSMIMEDFTVQGGIRGGYDSRNSGVFVIAFSPRKFAWHPSANALFDLNLGPRAQVPFTARFERAAKTRPANYGKGIAALVTAYDDYVFDRTDPTRIAARAEAERLHAEKKRLAAAQGALDAQIQRLGDLLNSDAQFLPEPAAPYIASLAKARLTRMEGASEEMVAEVASLVPTVDVLEDVIYSRRQKYRDAMIKSMILPTTLGLLIFTLILLLKRQRKRQDAFLAKWINAYSVWDQIVSAAHQRWTDHYLEREGVLGLEGVTGRTKELFDKTTEAVDGIIISVQAMQKHCLACQAIFKKGNLFNFGPYKEALFKIDAPFEFDTEEVNRADLFGGETVTVTVNPADFIKATGDRFRASVEDWDTLQQAADLRLSAAAAEDMPHDVMDQLLELCTEHSIPDRWLREHPLYGDDDSDLEFYARMDALRQTDPLAYFEEGNAFHRSQEGLLHEMIRMGSGLETALASKMLVNTPKGTNLAPTDDPSVTLTNAHLAEDKLARMLATSDDKEEVVGQTFVIQDLYILATKQGAEATAAQKDFRDAIKRAKFHGNMATKEHNEGCDRVMDATSVHADTQRATDYLLTAMRLIKKGEYSIRQTKKSLGENRHLDARRLANEAERDYKSARDLVRQAINYCTSLDDSKARYEAKADQMGSIRGNFERKMRGYGSHASLLPDVDLPKLSITNNFEVLITMLDRLETDMRRRARRAEDAYNTEQRDIRRRRDEEERAERRRDEEERQRQSSYYSSQNDGDFGGGGFGGSSGDFGGGGFGGSSGSF